MAMFPIMNDPNQKSWHQTANTLSQIALVVIGVLSLVLGVFNSQSSFPPWLPIFLVALGLVGLFLLLSPPTRALLKKWRLRSLAHHMFPQLIRLVDKFGEIVSPRRSDTIVYALGNIQRRDEWKGSEIQFQAYSQLFDLLMSNLSARARNVSKRYRDFDWIVNDLCSLVRSFQQLYFFEVIQKLRQKGLGTIGEDNKRVVDVSREAFASFLNSLDEFCKEANQKARSEVFTLYFSKVEPL
jgi:hypothetical protein